MAAAHRVFPAAQWRVEMSSRPATGNSARCRERPSAHLGHLATGFAIRRGIDYRRNADVKVLGMRKGFQRWGADIAVRQGGRQLRLLSVHLISGCWGMREDRNQKRKQICDALRGQIRHLKDWADARIRVRRFLCGSPPLSPYGIRTETLRFSGHPAKGYRRTAFRKAWDAYLSQKAISEPLHRCNPHSPTDSGDAEPLQRRTGATVSDPPNSVLTNDCNGATVRKPEGAGGSPADAEERAAITEHDRAPFRNEVKPLAVPDTDDPPTDF